MAVAAVATGDLVRSLSREESPADPSLADGKFWSSPSPGICTTGATPGRGGRGGMPSSGPISIASAIVRECFLHVERM